MNNICLWEGMLKMRINNGSKFELEPILKDINRAIEKLVNVKMGVTESLEPMEGTDEFLIDLLVTRFRLLIASGYIGRAVAMLQALAEFHFFRPAHLDQNYQNESPQSHLERALSEFEVFWNCGAKRIGEERAEGWCLLEDEGFNALKSWKEDEEGALDRDEENFRPDENRALENCRDDGKPWANVRMRKLLEDFRTQCYWKPLRIYFEGQELHEHRYVDFSEIWPLLFPMENVELLRELIYKMLHLLGVPIPGLKFNSQEDILGAFSTLYFASTRPNTMKLHMFEKFINDFVGLIACSEKMDEKRIYTGILSCISNSSEKISTKIEKLKSECEGIEKRTSYLDGAKPLERETKLAFVICALDQIAHLQAEPNTPKQVKDDPFVLEMSLTKLLDKNTPFWTFGIGQPERLFHLRFLAHIVRKLPFSDAENVAHQSVKFNLIVNRRKIKMELLNKKLLLSFWATGKLAPFEENQETINAAWTRVTDQLKNGAPPDDQTNLQYRWLGHEYELLFELAALFCYEFPRDQIVKYKYFERDIPLFTSELAMSLKDSAAVQEIRIRVLQHMMHISKGNLYTPGNLGRMLERQMESYPHSIYLLRTYLDVTYGLKQRNFLYRKPGKDPLTRLIRNCGRLYMEWKQLITSLKELEKTADVEEEAPDGHEENPDQQREIALSKEEKKRMMMYWARVVQKIAEEHSNNLVPDDYIWCNLMSKMVIEKRQVSFAAIAEVFTIGQQVCPWSKQFLLKATTTQTKTLNDCMHKHKLCNMSSDKELNIIIARLLA